MTAAVLAPWAEAWLPAFLLAAGLVLGALVALALGHLLGEAWMASVHPPLAALARGAPVLVLLALPLSVALPALYPWAAAPGASGWSDPGVFLLRSLAVLVLWTVLGRLLARRRVRGRTAGAALLALVLSGTIAMQDWALSRDPAWAGGLHGLALVVGQAGAALALATLLALRRAMPGDEARTGLERALLSLAMATLWLWFVQYIVVYAANLPPEAAWYLRRSEGVWGWIKAGIALPALLLAIGLALVPQWARWRLMAVSVLLLVQHVAQVGWIVRPDAALAGGAPSMLADALVAGLAAAAGIAAAWRHAGRPA